MQPLAYPSSTRSLLRNPFNPGSPSAGNRASLARLKRARPPHGSLWWVAPLHPRTQHMFRGSPLQRRPPQRAAWFYCHHSFLLSATSDAPSRKMRVATQPENSPRGLGAMSLGRHFEIADDKRHPDWATERMGSWRPTILCAPVASRPASVQRYDRHAEDIGHGQATLGKRCLTALLPPDD